MWHSVKVFLFLPPLLFALDYVWLGVFASKLYKRELGPLLRMSGNEMQPIVWAAVAVYLAIPLGILLFVLPRVNGGHRCPALRLPRVCRPATNVNPPPMSGPRG